MPVDSTALRASRGPAVFEGLRGWLLAIFGGSLMMAVAAHVAVPFWPVPLTLQTLAVLILGAALGPVLAATAVLAWIVEGLAGLPVFAGGLGPAVILGPTGGYIVGYVPAAAIAGLAVRQAWFREPVRVAALFLAADAVLFVCGVGRLAALIGWEKAIAGGLLPFLLGEALKLGLATAVGVALARRFAHRA